MNLTSDNFGQNRDFPTFLKSGTRGLLNLGEKHLDFQNWEKLELDRYFKWIKNYIRN